MKRRRLRDQIFNEKSKREIMSNRLRKWRLKTKRHSNRSKKSFYKTRYWELHNFHLPGVVADSRNDMKRTIERAYRKSDKVCIVHRSMGWFHNRDNNYYTFTATDAKTRKHVLTVDAMTEEELTLRLAVAGYDRFVWNPSVSMVIE